MLDHHYEVLRAHGYHPLVVKRVVAETADAKSFVLDVPEHLRAAFAYAPGQFCTFRARVGGQEYLRSYSMSSAPEADPDLAVTVKRVPGGVVSNWFNDQVAEGDTLEVTRPAGVFCPRARRDAVVGFCGGSGVTPVMSVTKSVLAGTDRMVRLIYANRDPSSVIFAEALEGLRSRYRDRMDLRHHFDSERGFMQPDDVARAVDGVLDGDFYICGPTRFMDLVELTLSDLGVGPDRVLVERFNLDEPGGDTPAVRDVTRAAMPPGPAGPGATTETVTLIVKGRPTTVGYRPGDTILETARRAGLQPPYSCEAGNCATCMAFLKGGAVSMRANNALTPEEVEEGWVLTCQSLPTTEAVTVEYESL